MTLDDEIYAAGSRYNAGYMRWIFQIVEKQGDRETESREASMRGVKGGEPVILLAFLVGDNGRDYQVCGECGESGQLIAAGNKARGTSLSNGAWQSGCIGLKATHKVNT